MGAPCEEGLGGEQAETREGVVGGGAGAGQAARPPGGGSCCRRRCFWVAGVCECPSPAQCAHPYPSERPRPGTEQVGPQVPAQPEYVWCGTATRPQVTIYLHSPPPRPRRCLTAAGVHPAQVSAPAGVSSSGIRSRRCPSHAGVCAPALTAAPAPRRCSPSHPAMVDVLGGRRLLTRDGAWVEAEAALQNKVVALYFAAGRCASSRDFAPLLCRFYAELVAEARTPAPFEVVFVSADGSEQEMLDFMRELHGAWLALPFDDPLRQ